MKVEKRKVLHSTVNVVKPPAKKAKLPIAPAASAAGALPAASAAGGASTPQGGAEPVDPSVPDEKPDEQCMAMFGDLGMYN